MATVRGLSPNRLALVGVLAMLVALGSWALASPVGASPDEDYHLVSIWCSHGARAGVCEPATDGASARVPSALLSSSCYAFHPDQSAACQPRPPAGDDMVPTTHGNFAGIYPPVFYYVDGLFVGHDLASSVIVMRIVNLLLFLAVFTAIYLLIPPRLRRPMVAGTLLTAVPLVMFLVPSINPSGWAILSAATFLVSLLGFLTTEDRRRRIALAAAAGFILLLGAGARADAAMYAVVAIGAALILTARPDKPTLRRLIYPAILAILAGVAFLSAGQSGAINPDNAPANHFSLARLLRVALEIPALWIGGMGAPAPFNGNLPAWAWGLGWLDTAMPSVVWVGVGGVYAAVLFSALARAGVRRILAVGLVGLAAFLVPAYIQVLFGSPVGGWVQPRYVLPLLAILIVTAMVRLDGTAFQLTRGQRWIVAAILVVGNAVALYTNVRRYVTGTDGKDWNLDRNMRWWWNIPVPPMAVIAVGALAFAVAVIVLTTEVAPVTTITGDDDSAEAAADQTALALPQSRRPTADQLTAASGRRSA